MPRLSPGSHNALRVACEVMRTYKSPANGDPYSPEGLDDLERQLGEASRVGDSSLLEMAALTIRKLRLERAEQEERKVF